MNRRSFFFFLFVTFIVLNSSCSSLPHNYEVMGPDEFVTDSYKIRQGKMAILEMSGIEYEPLEAETLKEYVDSVFEDDILNIAIYHPTRKDLIASFAEVNNTIGFRVRNGMVKLPDLPPIQIAGLTLEEARLDLQKHLQEQIQDIEVFVAYKDRLSRRVELMGLVGASSIPVDGKIRLYETLAQARVATNANLFMSYIMRQGKLLPIDFHRLMMRGDMSQNIVMRGGDKIYIAAPQDSVVTLMGEILRPFAVPVPYGSVSLREAIVTAGGIPFTGNTKNIQIIRGNLQNPKIYVLAWDHILHLPNDSLLLMPGDTVYISPKPITQWNRFISQLLPSATSLQTGYSTYSLLSK